MNENDNNDNIVAENVDKLKKGLIKFHRKNGISGDLCILLSCILILVCIGFTSKDLLISSVSNFTTSFGLASENAKNDSYQKSYEVAKEKAYEKAKKENAIHNDVYIYVDQIREMSKYEVFSVIEYATVIESETQKEKGIYAWSQYEGKGEFSVDLEQSEILVDHANYYVSIKIPHTTMTYVPINSKDLLYQDDRKNLGIFPKKDSDTGFDIPQELESKGNSEIYKKLNSKEYFDKADEAAISRLTDLVKLLNSEIADKLVIEIEFND